MLNEKGIIMKIDTDYLKQAKCGMKVTKLSKHRWNSYI